MRSMAGGRGALLSVRTSVVVGSRCRQWQRSRRQTGSCPPRSSSPASCRGPGLAAASSTTTSVAGAGRRSLACRLRAWWVLCGRVRLSRAWSRPRHRGQDTRKSRQRRREGGWWTAAWCTGGKTCGPRLAGLCRRTRKKRVRGTPGGVVMVGVAAARQASVQVKLSSRQHGAPAG